VAELDIQSTIDVTASGRTEAAELALDRLRVKDAAPTAPKWAMTGALPGSFLSIPSSLDERPEPSVGSVQPIGHGESSSWRVVLNGSVRVHRDVEVVGQSADEARVAASASEFDGIWLVGDMPIEVYDSDVQLKDVHVGRIEPFAQ
jgi:hypothetical protein